MTKGLSGSAYCVLADDGSVKLTDFGLSKPTHAAGTGQEIGYVAHLPPEALAGPSEITTIEGDIFAMGVTLYRLIEGDSLLDSMWANAVAIEQEILAGRFPPTQFSPPEASLARPAALGGEPGAALLRWP